MEEQVFISGDQRREAKSALDALTPDARSVSAKSKYKWVVESVSTAVPQINPIYFLHAFRDACLKYNHFNSSIIEFKLSKSTKSTT